MDTNDFKVTTTEVIGPQLERLQSVAGMMGGLGAVLAAWGGFLYPQAVPQGFLIGYLLWFGVALGSLGLLMLNHTVGGGWGVMIRRFLESASRMLPLMAGLLVVYFILAFVVPGHMYPWTEPEKYPEIAHAIHAKQFWLNLPGFLGRSVFYFAVWIGLMTVFKNRGEVMYQRLDLENAAKLNVWGGAGILIYVLTLTFATVDWLMTIQPEWNTSIIGLLFAASQALTTLAFMHVLYGYLVGETPFFHKIPNGYFRDLGNLTLATVMFWAYTSFSQYLITYSGNTAEEVTWYVIRTRTDWSWIGASLVALHFALPFLVLLIWSDGKRDPRRTMPFFLFLIFMRWVDLWWWVAPSYRRAGIDLNPAYLGMPLLIGGIFLYFWINEVKDKPAVPLYDPRFQEAMAETHGAAHEAVTHG